MSDSKLSSQDFLEAGLESEEIYPGVFVVKNFLTSEDVEILIDQFSSMTQGDWTSQYTASLYEFIKNQYGVDTFEEAQELGYRIEIDNNWVDKNALIEDQNLIGRLNTKLGAVFSGHPELEFNGIGSVQRQYEGVYLNEHVDSESNPLVKYACVIYVNDDFTGGELNFPLIGLKYQPIARSLIVFPSSSEFLHGVLPVGPGPTRYALPAFINQKEAA
jgi:hypothetical protein